MRLPHLYAEGAFEIYIWGLTADKFPAIMISTLAMVAWCLKLWQMIHYKPVHRAPMLKVRFAPDWRFFLRHCRSVVEISMYADWKGGDGGKHQLGSRSVCH
jgi:hypothetical protein